MVRAKHLLETNRAETPRKSDECWEFHFASGFSRERKASKQLRIRLGAKLAVPPDCELGRGSISQFVGECRRAWVDWSQLV